MIRIVLIFNRQSEQRYAVSQALQRKFSVISGFVFGLYRQQIIAFRCRNLHFEVSVCRIAAVEIHFAGRLVSHGDVESAYLFDEVEDYRPLSYMPVIGINAGVRGRVI